MLELTIVVLTLIWLLSFFTKSLLPGIIYNRSAFTDLLAVVIVLLIMFHFLT